MSINDPLENISEMDKEDEEDEIITKPNNINKITKKMRINNMNL